MYEFKTPPYDHQKKRIQVAWKKPGYADFSEMGTGKTKAAIDEMCMMYEESLIDAAVIIAPKGVYKNWSDREFPTHAPERIKMDIVVWGEGSGKRHQENMSSLFDGDRHFKILVINVEAFSQKGKAWELVMEFLNHRTVAIYVDESTTIKNPTAKRTKNVIAFRPLSKYRRIMTGNCTPRSPMDLYSQFEFLGEKMLGFSSYYSFRARHAIMKKIPMGGRKIDIIVGYREIEDLMKKIEPHSFRVRKDECLDLPPKIYTYRDVEMTDEQERMYREIKASATTALDANTHVTATEIIVQILRLHQILCGHVKDEVGVIHEVPTKRIAALLEVVEENGGKTIIWSRFRHDIDKIVVALGEQYGPESVVQYHGGVDDAKRKIAIDRFQEDPKCRFFVGNPQTGGRGITLHAAQTVVYYSTDYDLDARMQSEDRAHRSGLKHSVTYVDMVCRGTMEEKIIKALRKKLDVSSLIMGDGYREWLI